jgi:PAS domain S-box-containing protein
MKNIIILVLLFSTIICLFIIWRIYRALQNQKKNTDNNELEKRFESLVENGLDCVIIISPDCKTKYVSRSIKNILGYTPAEVLNMDIRELIHPDDLAGSEEALIKTIQNPGIPIQGYTSRIRHKNGSWRWIEPVVTNLTHDPSINGIVDNFRDVTDRKNAEEEVKNTNERFLLATKGSKLGIWDMDFLNNVLIWDEAMYRIYNVSSSSFDLNPDSWLSLIHEEDRHLLQKQVKNALNNGIGFDLDFRIVRPDLSVRYIRSLAQIYHDSNGKIIRMVGTNLDITSYKDYEQTLEQIIFDISHIIRKPVSNILGISNLIDIDGVNKTDLKKLATYMKESAKELDDFIFTLTENYSKKKLSIKGLSENNN